MNQKRSSYNVYSYCVVDNLDQDSQDSSSLICNDLSVPELRLSNNSGKIQGFTFSDIILPNRQKIFYSCVGDILSRVMNGESYTVVYYGKEPNNILEATFSAGGLVEQVLHNIVSQLETQPQLKEKFLVCLSLFELYPPSTIVDHFSSESNYESTLGNPHIVAGSIRNNKDVNVLLDYARSLSGNYIEEIAAPGGSVVRDFTGNGCPSHMVCRISIHNSETNILSTTHIVACGTSDECIKEQMELSNYILGNIVTAKGALASVIAPLLQVTSPILITALNAKEGKRADKYTIQTANALAKAKSGAKNVQACRFDVRVERGDIICSTTEEIVPEIVLTALLGGKIDSDINRITEKLNNMEQYNTKFDVAIQETSKDNYNITASSRETLPTDNNKEQGEKEKISGKFPEDIDTKASKDSDYEREDIDIRRTDQQIEKTSPLDNTAKVSQEHANNENNDESSKNSHINSVNNRKFMPGTSKLRNSSTAQELNSMENNVELNKKQKKTFLETYRELRESLHRNLQLLRKLEKDRVEAEADCRAIEDVTDELKIKAEIQASNARLRSAELRQVSEFISNGYQQIDKVLLNNDNESSAENKAQQGVEDEEGNVIIRNPKRKLFNKDVLNGLSPILNRYEKDITNLEESLIKTLREQTNQIISQSLLNAPRNIQSQIQAFGNELSKAMEERIVAEQELAELRRMDREWAINTILRKIGVNSQVQIEKKIEEEAKIHEQLKNEMVILQSARSEMEGKLAEMKSNFSDVGRAYNNVKTDLENLYVTSKFVAQELNDEQTRASGIKAGLRIDFRAIRDSVARFVGVVQKELPCLSKEEKEAKTALFNMATDFLKAINAGTNIKEERDKIKNEIYINAAAGDVRSVLRKSIELEEDIEKRLNEMQALQSVNISQLAKSK